MPRKRKQEEHWKGWKTLLINGEYVSRIKYEQKFGEPEFCDGCRIQKGSLHKWGCCMEKSPCQSHKFVVDCDCPIRENEEV